MDGTVLVADDDRTIRTVLTQALTRAGAKVHATSSLTTLMRWIDEGRGDLVITDIVMPDGDGLKMVPLIRERRPELPVIVISAQNTLMTAIQAQEADAWDYLPKPFDLPDLMSRVARGLQRTSRPAGAARSRPAAGEELPLIGTTPVMQALYRTIARVLNADLPVLILGESGTGKTAIARTLHDYSDRRNLPLVLAGEAELMATDGPSELVSRARGGVLVLEGITDFGDAAQARAVRMIDAAGEGGPRLVATALIGAGASPASGLAALRPDLLYRLSGIELVVPPLRERVDDIPLLAEAALARLSDDTPAAQGQSLSAGAMALLRRHPWPGNVRQLENFVRRLGMTASRAEIGEEEVRTALEALPDAAPGAAEAGESLGESAARHIRRYFALHGGALPPPGVHGRILREVERPLIEVALAATGGNQARCAELLGINRNTLRKKIADLGIEVTRRRRLM